MRTAALAIALLLARACPAAVRDVTVTVRTDRPIARFDPARAIGAGLDGHEKGETAAIFTPANVRAMKSAGLGALTYRLRTELGIEAWHWNPRGAWSDPARRQGYWTSDDRPGAAIAVSYGYRLPRRGNTIDQANNDGYSRLTDGDPNTFWKSNPYLDSRYTGEDDALHPQWVVVDLGRPVPVDAMRILWGAPFAERYRVEYWLGDNDPDTERPDPGRWRPFPGGAATDGHGGLARLRLAPRPIPVRFVRVTMTHSSHTAAAASTDPRDRLGFAVRELYVGRLDARGRFRDLTRHGTSAGRQTHTFASSTDPWHRAGDVDFRTEQPGLDLVYRSGLTRGLPMLVPAGLLYDTKENAAAMLRYLRARGYAVERVELGEEPDEQYTPPEDVGALYVQYVRALRAVDPRVSIGGCSHETITMDVRAWPRERTVRPWMTRFTGYLRARSRLADFQFFSFEWYPFDTFDEPTSAQLRSAPTLLRRSLERLVREGLPRGIPWLMTEYGYSAQGCSQEVDLPGAIFNAEAVCTFLAMRGEAAYLYGYEPAELLLEANSPSYGNNALLLWDEQQRIRCRTATYYAARLLATEWAQPGGGPHELYAATTGGSSAREIVSAYAVKRPDHRWAVLLTNKDPHTSYRVRVRFDDGRAVRGPLDLYQFGPAQYVWHPAGEHGYPRPDLPPAHVTRPTALPVTLPPFSIAVVRLPTAPLP